MQITCLGASGHVTGSNFLIENDKSYLVDCGFSREDVKWKR